MIIVHAVKYVTHLFKPEIVGIAVLDLQTSQIGGPFHISKFSRNLRSSNGHGSLAVFFHELVANLVCHIVTFVFKTTGMPSNCVWPWLSMLGLSCQWQGSPKSRDVILVKRELVHSLSFEAIWKGLPGILGIWLSEMILGISTSPSFFSQQNWKILRDNGRKSEMIFVRFFWG